MADGTRIEWTEATWNPITGEQCKVDRFWFIDLLAAGQADG